MTKPTAFQMLTAVAEITGTSKVILRPNESLLAVKMTNDSISLSIEKLSVIETAREIRYLGRTLRMIGFTKADDKWTFSGQFFVEDESYVPSVIVKYGRVETPAEYLARVDWERDCARPAEGIESYDKTYSDATYGQATPGMLRHWKITDTDLRATSGV